MNLPWSVWLLPKYDDQLRLKILIQKFSLCNPGSYFDAHVTLFGRVSTEPESFFSFISEEIKYQEIITLNTKSINRGRTPWKTLYLDFEENRFLNQLQKKITEPLKEIREYAFKPHLSLAYGQAYNQKYNYRHISLDKKIEFSSVALAYVPDKIQDWNIIKEFKFNVN